MSHCVALRESASIKNQPVQLKGIVDPDVDIEIPAGTTLVKFASAIVGMDSNELARARGALVNSLGIDALVASALIAANFSRNDRIADATGIPLEAEFLEQSSDFRAELGFNDFLSARNSLRAPSNP